MEGTERKNKTNNNNDTKNITIRIIIYIKNTNHKGVKIFTLVHLQ